MKPTAEHAAEIRQALEQAGVHPSDATRTAGDLAERTADRELMRAYVRQIFGTKDAPDA